jgi:cytochrome b subunit of formate dehydrogenase
VRLQAALVCLIALSALALAPLPGRAAEPSADQPTIPNERCLGCHDDAELTARDGRSVAVHADLFAAAVHRRLDCVACHADALTTRHPRNNLGKVAVAACADCHEEEIAKLAGSVHASSDGSASRCLSCHGDVHTIARRRDLLTDPLSPVNQMRVCGQCHKDMMEGYLGSEHARALLVAGLTSAPACTSCHGDHDILPRANPESRTSHSHSPETCGRCHELILVHWKDESTHGTLWKNGEAGPVCTTCHTAHGIEDPTSVAMRTRFPDECGTCHEEQSKTFHDSFHGKATELGSRQAAICSDCHTPHQNLPASDPRSSIHPDHLAQTCGQCHKNVNASFLTFDPHNDPTDPHDNLPVHVIWFLMTGLLLGVFGFFGLHDLLWLQRTLVGKLRGEFAAVHGGAGQYVRRFSGMQIGLHLTIILSFLLLATTGLPLKFAAATWAPALMTLLGGPQTAGWLHRFAAAVTFGYFAVHILQSLYEMLVRKEKGYLWGPRSMVPQPQDVADMWNSLKYFLYLGPRPKFDRWTYWEKFDYLAVFWGVAIIGASGLVLWFPGFFTRFLPGWSLNAAYVIHSDEALLATGFIFLFHFFHTHLRPEAFPMDPVIFTGSMPLERFKEERPLEYQRLVEQDGLQRLLVQPPTGGTIARAYIFGFTAVTIGITLAVLIFLALLRTLG